MIRIGGQRPLIAAANFSPSMDPGIWISVNTTVMSKTGLEDRNRLVRVGSFNHQEAGLLNHFGRLLKLFLKIEDQLR
jgi:hypothetical protein